MLHNSYCVRQRAYNYVSVWCCLQSRDERDWTFQPFKDMCICGTIIEWDIAGWQKVQSLIKETRRRTYPCSDRPRAISSVSPRSPLLAIVAGRVFNESMTLRLLSQGRNYPGVWGSALLSSFTHGLVLGCHVSI